MHFIMTGKQAKILSDQQTRSLLVFASTTRNPRRNHLILLLSLKAGLRAGEIAKLNFAWHRTHRARHGGQLIDVVMLAGWAAMIGGVLLRQ
jgi:integrase